MPAVSQQQREFLNWKFGHKWTKKHHFDNKGKLPHTHHEDEDEKKDESMDIARVRLMQKVLKFEKANGKTLSEDEERFLSEDISTMDIGPGPSTRDPRKEDEDERERKRTFLAKRKTALRKKVPNPTHDMQA